MRPMLKVNTISLNSRKVGLLGTSALVCLAFSTPAMAAGITITSYSGSDANGNITITAGDVVTLTGAVVLTGTNAKGIVTPAGGDQSIDLENWQHYDRWAIWIQH